MSTEVTQPAATPEAQTSTSNSTTPTVSAPAITTPAAAITPQPESAASKGAKVEITSDELKRRLDETRTKAAADERAALLKSLGVTDEADLKAKVTEAKRLEDEKRTDLEKRDVRIKELEPKASRADELEPIVKAIVDEQEAGLNDAQKAVVAQLGGNDPAKRLGVIKALRSALPAAPVVSVVAQPTTPAATAPIPQAANTAAPAAPAPTGTTSVVIDHLSTWEGLKAKNDFVRASQYYLKHTASIVAAQKARG